MAKRKPIGKRHNLQDATKPLDDFDRLARKRLGLPGPEKLVNPSRRRWLPSLLLPLVVAGLIGYSVQRYRLQRHIVFLPYRTPLAVSFLDVGQGDSTLIQTPSGKFILIDTGPPDAASSLFAELRQRGVRQLDQLIITHPDADHDGNAVNVLRFFTPRTVVDSGLFKASRTRLDMLTEIKRQNIPLVNATQNHLIGTSQDLGGLLLTYLGPLRYSPDPNDNSLILKISCGRVSLLLMGDAESKERADLLASGYDVQATILKVAHHGALNGTDLIFLTRVHPEVAVISCGLPNRFGHPSPGTLRALGQAGVKVWRTDLRGTINVQTDGRTYSVNSGRK